MKRTGRGEDHYERRAGYSSGAFADEQESQKHDGLLREAEVDAGGLRNEDQGERLVQARTIEIEAVASRKNEGYGFARHAKGFHLFHGTRESSFGTGGGKGDGHRLRNGAEEFLHRHAYKKGDGKQHTGDEDDQRNVHGGEQF